MTKKKFINQMLRLGIELSSTTNVVENDIIIEAAKILHNNYIRNLTISDLAKYHKEEL